ncbi:MAG: cysteine--tRNA ligase [Candidatus Heimdallarchaeota archaeon]|nr:cysteine--tRNA ligase [Candidatus Heimdallarchaeota archaeon]
MTIREIMLYNTETRQKEKLEPITPGIVKFYSCGQTVYEDVHVGNFKTYSVWDLLVRTLKHFGYQVIHVQNFTDVGHLTDDADEGEDKIQKKAAALKMDPMELVDIKIREYHQNMDQVNINRPNIAPRATGHINEMIEMIKTLINKNHAYEVDGSVYFDISTFDDYGKMARLDLENLRSGARVEVIAGKRNPGDFALWIKAPPEHIMKYNSPWSIGYPGWHLECSVMAIKYLGETIDIHAGGIDHIPVHHTNEIAQSECATGKKFANIWMHSAFITVNGEKMSKSKNNFFTLSELIEELGPAATRFALSTAHYRTQADFSLNDAQSQKKRYYRLVKSYQMAQQYLVAKEVQTDDTVMESFLERFNVALADDLNTPKAMIQVNAVGNRLDKARKAHEPEKVKAFMTGLETMLDVLGIPLVKLTDAEITEINTMVQLRIKLKAEGDFKASDEIREFLQKRNYILQDLSPTETIWYREE